MVVHQILRVVFSINRLCSLLSFRSRVDPPFITLQDSNKDQWCTLHTHTMTTYLSKKKGGQGQQSKAYVIITKAKWRGGKLTAIGFVATVTAVGVAIAFASDIDARSVRAAEFTTAAFCCHIRRRGKAIINSEEGRIFIKSLFTREISCTNNKKVN